MRKTKTLLEHYQKGLKKMQEVSPSTLNTRVYSRVYEAVIDYFSRAISMAEGEREKKVCWHGPAIPGELLLAMDLNPYCIEVMVSTMPSYDPFALKEFVELGEQAGLPPEMCTIDKGSLGLMLSGEFPAPDLFIGCSFPCDNIVIGHQMYDRMARVPTFHLDCPYGNEEKDIEFIVKGMKRLITFLEEQTQRKLDYDRLKELMDETNRAYGYWLEICELRKAVPCPLPSRFLALSNFVNIFLPGDKRGTELYKTILQEGIENLKRGEETLKNERSRLLWIHVPLFYDFGFFEWLEKEHQCLVPMQMFAFLPFYPLDTSSTEGMIRSLAIKAINYPMVRQTRGPLELYTDDLYRIIEEYKADCIVFSGHRGCKHGWGSMALIKDFCKEMGKPLLILDLDVLLPGPSTIEDVKNSLSTFLSSVVHAL